MTFAHPHILWLLALPAALLLASSLLRARAKENLHPKIPRAVAHPGHSSFVISHSSFQRHRPLAAAFALACLITALARPQGAVVSSPSVVLSRDVLVAVDVSRSMLADDVKASRLDRARLLVRNLADELHGERLGLLPFAGTAFLQSPLSADYEIFRTFLDELGPDMIPAGGSNFAALLQVADEAFGPASAPAADAPPAADRFLVILSDGEAEDDAWRPLAKKLGERGVRVVALGLGTSAGATVPDGQGGLVKDSRGAAVLSRLQPATLQELSRLTDGAYRDASSWVDLPALLRETVARGRASENLSEGAARRAELFPWFLAPALLLAALALAREFPVTPRVSNKPLRPAPAALALATLLLAALHEVRPAFAAARDADPLVALVQRLASEPSLSAADLARLAALTAEQGEAARSSAPGSAPVPEGALRDALAAVQAGESADPRAADWARLRQRLEALLAPEKQPPPDENKPDQSPRENKPGESPPSPKPEDPKPESGPPPDPAQDGSPGQASNPRENPADSPPPKEAPPLGDLGEEPKASPPSAKPETPTEDPPTQQAGGVSASGRPDDADPDNTPVDPALALPRQRLERVRDADAPARLFQLLQQAEDPKNRDPAAPGSRQTW